MDTNKNRVVVTVVGKDRKGIIAAVSGALSGWEVNILGTLVRPFCKSSLQ